jgi:phosphoglucomutase
VIAQKSPFAGKTIEPSMLVNVPRLVTAYFTGKPDPTVASQRVAFGTSGHRGSAFDNAFNEAHILAIIIGAKAASTAHCLSALTRTRCPSPP